MATLKKELSLIDLVFYAIGIILGAGIYVLIGPATAEAGNSTWISFLVAAIIASFTGLSYAELSSMYPRDAAEYTYVKKAFKDTTAGFVIGWLTFFMAVIAGSVIAIGFGQYLHNITGLSSTLGAISLLLFFAAVNYLGIKITSRLNIILTLLAVLGLLMIIAIGLPHFGSVNYFEMPNGYVGIFGAAAIIFFAYLGFDEIVNVSEEAKNARKNVPKAILISITVTTVLYVLVSVSAVSTVPWNQIGASGTPLAMVAQGGLGAYAGIILSIFALFATAGTSLVLMITASRMLFGMAEDHAMPNALVKLSKRKTPYVCIAIITVLASGFVFFSEIKSVALLVNFSAFLVFAIINLAVILLRFDSPKEKRPFKTPINIGKLPVLPVLGLLISSYMLLQFTLNVAWIIAIIMILGYIFYKFLQADKLVR